METILIRGGRSLKGAVTVGGAKNAALPIIAGSLLSEGDVTINGVPNLEDVHTMCEVLRHLGVEIKQNKSTIRVRPRNLGNFQSPDELVRRMRASFLIMGPLLARLGTARMSLPGGCAIGSRPIDLHLKGFAALGAEIFIGYGYVEARAPRKGLLGGRVYLDFPSVGATENAMMAACLASGTTTIENAAQEPEVADLASFLNAIGARVEGAGTSLIRIEGVKALSGATHTIIPDRIEAGTYMVAAAITGGDVLVENAIPDHMKSVAAKLRESGAEVNEESGGIRVKGYGRPVAVDIKTMPYPGFPTDMQAQMMSLLAVAKGTGLITETVFENRFMHAGELKRMGANIRIDGRCAIVEGVRRLAGIPVKATDLRAGAALILAGLVAEGETEITCVHHIDRGYEHIEDKLRRLGAWTQREVSDFAASG